MNSCAPRVYIVDGSVSVTGAFICARNMALALRDICPVFLVLPRNSSITAEDTSPFEAVYHLPIRGLRRNAGAVIMYLPSLLISSIILRWWLWRHRQTVLIINDFYLMHGAMCRLLGYSGPILTWIRIAPTVFGNRIPELWLWASAKSSNKLISVSRYIQSLLPSRLSTQVIYDCLSPMPTPIEEAEKRDCFIYVGNYIPGKGQDYAIEAFSILSEEFPLLSLHFYGSDMGLVGNRAYKRDLKHRIDDLGLRDRVFLHDFSRDPLAMTKGALAALNFSSSESFSMTVLEAQGAGLAVVATRSGGPAEIIEHGETGLLVPLGDVPGMVSAMRIIAANPLDAVAMGKAGRQRILCHFSPRSYRKALIEAIFDV